MATKKKLADKELSLKIINIEEDPMDPTKQRRIVSIEFNDNTDKGPWIQGFSLRPPITLSMDAFLENVLTQDIHRPDNPWLHLEEAQKASKTFIVDLSHNVGSKSNS